MNSSDLGPPGSPSLSKEARGFRNLLNGVGDRKEAFWETNSHQQEKKWSKANNSTENSKGVSKGHAEFSVEELLQSLSKDSTPQNPTPTAERSPHSASGSSSGTCAKHCSGFPAHGSVQQPYAVSGVNSGMSGTGIEAEAALELHTVEASAGSPWDVDSLLGLKRVGLSETPSGSSASQAAAVAVGPSSSAGAPSVPSGAPEGPSGTSKETHTSADATSLAEANLRNAQLEAEAQQLRHELLLLKRRMQCEAAAQQAQHEADSAAARAAWESEKQKLLIKNRTLQTTVDQTLARYEEDVRLLGQARGCVLQQQQLEQQQQHEQQQLQLQQALQAERDHWSARLQAANDEWRRRLQDEQRQAEAKLQQQQREIPAWHELHSLAQESRRHSEEFKRLLQSLQKQQQQQLQQQQLQLQQLHQQLHQQQRAEVAGTEKKCESCGRQAEMEGAVAALQQQQQTLQQQQQALALLAQETAKLRDETEQRTRVASAKLAAESLQLQSLHRSLLESRQQQQMLQQQQQQQLQQQQQFIEQQQHAFAQRQLQAESEVATKQLELDQKERDIERRESRLAGAVAIQEKQQKARRDYLHAAESHLLKLQNALQQERQELTETALALEEKRRELRRCFEDMEVQRLAFESRAAAAAAQAEAAAAEARDAKILQQESLQAKEAVHKLHLQAKDAERQQQEQQEIIKSLIREVETSRLELLRMQHLSGHLHVHRFPSGRCSVTGSSRVQLPYGQNHRPVVSQRRVRGLLCSSMTSSKALMEVAGAPFFRIHSHHGLKQPEGTFQEALQPLLRASDIIAQKREAAHERLWGIRNKTSNTSKSTHVDLQQMTTGVDAFQDGLPYSRSASLGRKPSLTCRRQLQQPPLDTGISEFTDGLVEATCASLASLEEVAAVRDPPAPPRKEFVP